MIALYIVAIVLVCGAIVAYFWWIGRKRKRILEGLASPKQEKGTEKKPKPEKKTENMKEKKVAKKEQKGSKKEQKKLAKAELDKDLKAVEKEVDAEEKKIAVELEDFVWDSEKTPAESPKPTKQTDAFDDFEDDMDDKAFETKMRGYETFLNNEQEDFPDEEISEEDKNDIDTLMSFDFDSLKGKSKAEVEEMIKGLSPAVQDFILNDILGRKGSEE